MVHEYSDLTFFSLSRSLTQVAVTMSELGRCALEAGRPLEAEELFRRVLEIADARLEPDDVLVVVTLHGGFRQWKITQVQ